MARFKGFRPFRGRQGDPSSGTIVRSMVELNLIDLDTCERVADLLEFTVTQLVDSHHTSAMRIECAASIVSVKAMIAQRRAALTLLSQLCEPGAKVDELEARLVKVLSQ